MGIKRAMFIGRWQPFHNGHKWLISQKLDSGVPALICVRDIPPDEKNPFTTEQTIHMLQVAYEGCDVTIMSIPDIESINWGRGVGYETNEHVPPGDVGFVSATSVREKIKNKDQTWKKNVDSKIWHLVEEYLSSSKL